MTVLTAQGLGKSYGTDVILRDVSFKVGATDKVGIVGVNGTGKTTLLKLLSGEEEPDAGTVALERGTVMAYMHQNADYRSQKTAVEEVLEVFAPLVEMGEKLDALNEEAERCPTEDVIARQCALHERFVAEGGLTYRARTESTLLGLGLTKEQISLPVSSLSGGQRTCVLLARLLLSGAGLLLLDEPTNHLDIRATEWLEEFLQTYRGAVLCVSHDRFFLDRVCGRIFETENTRLTVYNGNYTYYKEKKEADRVALTRDYEKKCEEIARIEGIIEQQKRFNQERNYVTIKSKQHQIDRIRETLVVPDRPPKEIRFAFEPSGHTGNDILTADVSLGFGDTVLLENAHFEVFKGEKVFVAGPNGCGKTTLLRRLVENGQGVRWGAGVRVGYYEQTGSALDPAKTVFDTVSDAYPRMNNTAIRSALGTFLFRGDDVFKRVGDLSGGERARVTLCLLMLSDTNVLVLDEPTNHLDLASKEMLEDALRAYTGTVLCVSHDRFFVNGLADKIFYIADRSLLCHRGNYASLLDVLRAAPARQTPAEPNTAAEQYRKKKQDDAAERKRKKRLEWLEEHIPAAENDLAALEAEMAGPDVARDYAKLCELDKKRASQKASLDALYEEWAALAE